MANYVNFNTTVDYSNFDRVFSEYMKWSKKQPAEVTNAKLYFIALQAKNLTKTADKGQIRHELSQPADKYPDSSIAQVLTAMQLRGKNQKVSGKQFTKKVEGFIKRSQSHINFLRAGWIPAIKKLDYWNRKGDIRFTKSRAPKDTTQAKAYGVEKGDVKPARLDQERVRGTIFNFVGQGKQASKTVHKLLQEGLDKGVKKEIASMQQHINEKINKKHQEMKRNTNNGVV